MPLKIICGIFFQRTVPPHRIHRSSFSFPWLIPFEKSIRSSDAGSKTFSNRSQGSRFVLLHSPKFPSLNCTKRNKAAPIGFLRRKQPCKIKCYSYSGRIRSFQFSFASLVEQGRVIPSPFSSGKGVKASSRYLFLSSTLRKSGIL